MQLLLYKGIFRVLPIFILITITNISYSQNVPIKVDNADSSIKENYSGRYYLKDSVMKLGYGKSVKRIDLTEAIGEINSEELNKSPFLYPGNSLFGKIPGLWVMQNSGFPDGRAPSLYIRGISTMGSQKVLVLVDGFERPLEMLKTEEIKDIKILKDAAAKAIYGQEGANGVILINTKKGGDHKANYNINYYQGITQPKRVPHFVNAQGYAKATNEALINDGHGLRYSPTEIEYYETGKFPKLYPNIDWVDQILGNFGNINDFNFSTSAGSEKATYFVDLGYYRETGFFNKEYTKKYANQPKMQQLNFLTKGDLSVTPSTEVGVNINFMFRNYHHPVDWEVMRDMYPIPSNAFPIKNEDGSWGGDKIYGSNPIAKMSDRGVNLNNFRYVSVNGRIKQSLSDFIEGLNLTFKAGYYNAVDAHENQIKEFSYKHVTPILGSNDDIIGTNEESFGKSTSLSPSRSIATLHESSADWVARLNYSTTLGLKDELNAIVLFHQKSRTTGVGNNVYRWQNLAGNFHYNLKDIYSLGLTISYSGNNRIRDVSHRWGVFPAISGSWNISNESFFNESSSVNALKLLASWGITGNGYVSPHNMSIPSFGYEGTYYFKESVNSFNGLSQSQLGSSYTPFESSYETNIGITSRLFNRLYFNVDIFEMKRKNIMVTSSGIVSGILGIDPGEQPDGVVKNRGFELELGWHGDIGHLNYSVKGQFSFSRNKIISMDEQFYEFPYLKKEGHRIGQQFGLETDGFFNNESEITEGIPQKFGNYGSGDIRYIDENEDGFIDSRDRIPMGKSSFPEGYYSAQVGIGYKGFELEIDIQGVSGRTLMLGGDNNIYWPLVEGANMSTWYTDYWSPKNKDDAKLPRLTTSKNDNNFRNNDIWQVNGNFLKIRYVELSYRIPKIIMSKINVDMAKLFLSGRDLYTFNSFKYADPENIYTDYPSIRVFSLGLQVKF